MDLGKVPEEERPMMGLPKCPFLLSLAAASLCFLGQGPVAE